MTGRFKQALLEMKKSKKGRKGKMPKNFSVSSGDKSKAGGLTKKGVKRYRAANPGSELKTAVTTKPSKLKKGSKSAKRRKSFCKRMGGMKKKLTSKKTASNPDSRINKALRKWNCSTDIVRGSRLALAEAVLKQAPNLRDRVRKAELEGTPRRIAIENEKRAQDDARVKDAQGKNTVTKTFGKKGTQTSTTAFGGGGGDQENITPPMSIDQINRSGSSTAKKATPRQTGAANIKLMKDMGAIKFDAQGRWIRPPRR